MKRRTVITIVLIVLLVVLLWWREVGRHNQKIYATHHIPNHRDTDSLALEQITDLNLYTAYYVDKKRQHEIDWCLRRNVNSNLFTNVYVLLEPPAKIPDDLVGRVTVVDQPTRAKFADFFDICRRVSKSGTDVNIITNSDICFDESILNMKRLRHNEAVVLTRWDVKDELTNLPPYKLSLLDNSTFFNCQGSFDTWIFRGRPKQGLKGNFFMGKMNCDQLIATEMVAAGYQIFNPCRNIYTYHVHMSNSRNYDPSDRLPGTSTFVDFSEWE